MTMTIALGDLVQMLSYSTSMTSVLSVVSETDETRCSSDGVFICKKVLKQRRSLSATQTTSILTALLKAAAVREMPAEIRRHRQVAFHSYAVASPTKLKMHYEVLQMRL